MKLTEVLRGGRQCDEDGVEIIMSRQACHEAADEIERLRTAIVQYLAENNTEGFGCACEPNYTCGPCNASNRQQVLRAALTPNAKLTGVPPTDATKEQ